MGADDVDLSALRARTKSVTLKWQGQVEGAVVAVELNGMMAIPDPKGITYVTREQAKAFFGLVEPLKPGAV